MSDVIPERYKIIDYLGNSRIIREFNIANANYNYADAIYLLEQYTDVLNDHLHTNQLRKAQTKINSIKDNAPVFTLSLYEEKMLCSAMDYCMLDLMYKNQLVKYRYFYTFLKYIDFSRKPSMLLYYINVIKLNYLPLYYKAIVYLHKLDLYVMIHKIVSNIRNDALLDAKLVTYNIYSFLGFNSLESKHYYKSQRKNEQTIIPKNIYNNIKYTRRTFVKTVFDFRPQNIKEIRKMYYNYIEKKERLDILKQRSIENRRAERQDLLIAEMDRYLDDMKRKEYRAAVFNNIKAVLIGAVIGIAGAGTVLFIEGLLRR